MEAQIPSRNEKRIRMIAGPNGSGKSTIYPLLNKNYDTGIYLNADDLEKELSSGIKLNKYGLDSISGMAIVEFIQNHSLTKKAIKSGFEMDIEFVSNTLTCSEKSVHSYTAAVLIDFIRDELLNLERKLTFETVMSHHSKIEILKKSNGLGYKSYLYFISTGSEDINIERVKMRVERGGHPVEEEKIISRYFSSMGLLREAVKNTYRSFIFDNSVKNTMILEVFQGTKIKYHYEDVPEWVEDYLLKKET